MQDNGNNGSRFNNDRFVSPAKRRKLEEIMCGHSKSGKTTIGFGAYSICGLAPKPPPEPEKKIVSPANGRGKPQPSRTGQLSGRKRKAPGKASGGASRTPRSFFPVAAGKENDTAAMATRKASKEPTPWTSRNTKSANTGVKSAGWRSPKEKSHEQQQLEEREARLEERRREIEAEYRAKVEELKNREYSMGQENQLLNQQLENQSQQYDNLLKEYNTIRERDRQARDVIIRLLKEKETHERRERERKAVDDNKRIGRVVWVRQSNFQMQEAWEDGEVFMELKRKSKEIERARQELENRRKQLKEERARVHKAAKKRKGDEGVLANGEKSNSPDDFQAPAPRKLDELTIQGEVYNLRHQELKKKFGALQEKSSNLQYQKKRHIRFLRLCRDAKASQFKDNPILNDRYLLMNLLGKGGFSEVYRAYDLQKHMYVACKIHQLNKSWPEERKRNYTKHATREYEIHKTLRHQRCVKLYDVFGINHHAFATVLELCDGVDMDMYLKIHKFIPQREARCIIMQLFSALKYFAEQSKPVIHYDLKPGNLLRLKDGSIKVTDFGLSKIMEQQGSMSEMELTSQGAGTYWYLPPECFRTDSPKISVKVDVWSAGVIFFQMLYGRRPFGHDLSQKLILQQQTILKSKQVVFPSQPRVDQEAKDFISRCLQQNPSDRPHPKEILDTDPFFAPVRKKSKA